MQLSSVSPVSTDATARSAAQAGTRPGMFSRTAWPGDMLTTLLPAALLSAFLVAALLPTALRAQAPLAGGLAGKWVEADAFYQPVSNDLGDWSGTYLRLVSPSTSDTWYADALALKAFGERGMQVGAAHRHDWNSRVFHMLGVNVGDGAAILPKARVDGLLGLRLGSRQQWQLSGGGSYVKSVTDLYDVAATASIAWYAPRALMLEVSGRQNWSRPGDIQSQRLSAVAVLTPSDRRSFSLRAIGGTEGWQTLTSTTTLTRFRSSEISLAWREKPFEHWAFSLQGDHYKSPYYTRAGVTLGVARYW